MNKKLDNKTIQKIIQILRQFQGTVSVNSNLQNKLQTFDVTQPCLVAIAGESGSGKSTLLSQIQLCLPDVTYFSTDNYFKDFSQGIQLHGSFDALLAAGYDMQAPFSIHLDLLREDLEKLKSGQNVLIPEHLLDGTGTTTLHKIPVKASSVIFVDGFCTLYDEVRDLFDFAVYLEPNPNPDIFLQMLSQRNINSEQAARILKILSVSSAAYIQPTKQYADVIINIFNASPMSTIEQIVRLFQPGGYAHTDLISLLKNPKGDVALLWNALSDKTKQQILSELDEYQDGSR